MLYENIQKIFIRKFGLSRQKNYPSAVSPLVIYTHKNLKIEITKTMHRVAYFSRLQWQWCKYNIDQI